MEWTATAASRHRPSEVISACSRNFAYSFGHSFFVAASTTAALSFAVSSGSPRSRVGRDRRRLPRWAANRLARSGSARTRSCQARLRRGRLARPAAGRPSAVATLLRLVASRRVLVAGVSSPPLPAQPASVTTSTATASRPVRRTILLPTTASLLTAGMSAVWLGRWPGPTPGWHDNRGPHRMALRVRHRATRPAR